MFFHYGLVNGWSYFGHVGMQAQGAYDAEGRKSRDQTGEGGREGFPKLGLKTPTHNATSEIPPNAECRPGQKLVSLWVGHRV